MGAGASGDRPFAGEGSRRVRALFAAALIALPLQVAFAIAVVEPWPAFMLPGFSGTGGGEGDLIRYDVPAVEVLTAAGGRVDIDHRDLFAQADISTHIALDSVFPRHGPAVDREPVGVEARLRDVLEADDRDRADDPATVAWLRRRIAELRPDVEPSAAVVTWRELAADRHSGEVVEQTVLSRYVVELAEGVR